MISKRTTIKKQFGAALIGLLFMGWLSPAVSSAQPVITAEGTAMGGSGTAYYNGFEATFWNPANLMIQDRPGQFHIGVGSGGGHYEPILAGSSIRHQASNFLDGYFPYKRKTVTITEKERATILDTHFQNQKLQAENQQQSELILGGALWQRKDYAFSIVARARYASRVTVGRGWYDDAFVNQNSQQLRDFSLSQQRSEYYELAIGYAQEFAFINGLLPQLNKLYIGISPKIIVAGPSFNASYDARYIRNNSSIRNPLVTAFSLQSSGSFSDATVEYLESRNPRQAIDQNFSDRYKFQPTGYGIGFDFGLNYIIPLTKGTSDLSEEGSLAPQKSFRIAFSLNDIGGIRYNEQPLSLTSTKDTLQAGQPASVDEMFIGSGGQYLSYLHQRPFHPNPLLTADEESSEKYSVLLPTSINAGILLDLSGFKFTGDLSVGLNKTAFTNTNLSLKAGIEVRPVEQIPIRLGTRLAKEQPFQLGFGTGIETRYWDLMISAQALFQAPHQPNTLSGGAFGGMQFHF
ncbi:DUF5723 family protein [Fodinibius salsisoli]|uniref:DUF5723 domain-containing protein n=1 Tax=Fodinibius salsisoli TaxID=2820877 RepID=A0ABT3PNA6_9BACT|nr:DUF5723 family protein [Fodinibius salsisoli]MCW9707323.1 hypothetical protein [Fodinibius salsisoli]